MARTFTAKKSSTKVGPDAYATSNRPGLTIEDIEAAEDTNEFLQQAKELAKEVLREFSL